MRQNQSWLMAECAQQVCKEAFNGYQAIVKRTLHDYSQRQAGLAAGAPTSFWQRMRGNLLYRIKFTRQGWFRTESPCAEALPRE